MNRQCARPSCTVTAAATLSYDYSVRLVWMEHLHLEPHPMTHDLCLRHADATTVPVGWEMRDVRTNDLPTVIHTERNIARAS